MTDATPDHTTRAHARLSPSSAHRWMNCPGSVEEQKGLPDTSGFYAREGTAAHELAELCGVQGVKPHSALGHKINVEGDTFDVTPEMADAVALYIDTVTAGLGPDDVLQWERRYPLPFLPGSSWGTADATRYNRATKTLTVFDLKYGAGNPVEAFENPQALCYAGGALMEARVPVQRVEIVIVQPRAWHAAGPVRRWELGVAEFADRLTDLAEAAERALKPNAPRVPGRWCKYCKAEATCATLSMMALAEAQMVFSENPVTPDQLTREQLGELAEKAIIIRSWAKAVEDHVHWLLNSGEKVPGWKLVNKRPQRQWVNPIEAADALKAKGLNDSDVFVTQIISPAQAEKLLPGAAKASLKPLMVSVSSGTTIAPAGDRRPEAQPGGPGTGDYRAVFTAIDPETD
jgi:hypothetical protein